MPAIDATNGTTFFSAQHAEGSAEPWPPLPMNPGPGSGFPVWTLGDDGVYLLSDLNYHYGGSQRIGANSASLSTTGGTMVMDADVLSPPGGVGTNGYNPPAFQGFSPNYGTNLYIAQMSQSAGNYSGIASSLSDLTQVSG